MCNSSLTPTPRATLSQSLFWKFAVDPAESNLFCQLPEGQIICLALESGELQWQSEETALPLRVTDDVLWAIQSEWVQANTGRLSAVRGAKDELQAESKMWGQVRYYTPAAGSEVLHYRVAAFSTETGQLLHTSEWMPTSDRCSEIEHVQSHGNLSEQTLEIVVSARPPRQGIARPRESEYFATLCQLNLVTGAVCVQQAQLFNALQLTLEWEDQSYPQVPLDRGRQRSLEERVTSYPQVQRRLEGRVTASAQLRHYWLLLQEAQSINPHAGFVKLTVLTEEAPHALKWERVIAPLPIERCPC